MYNKKTRDDFVKAYGKEAFDKVCGEDSNWAKLKEEPIPSGYNWLFRHFLSMYFHCEADFNGNMVFIPRSILDYEKCFGVEFSYRERVLLLSMGDWAANEIYKLNKSDD